MGFFDSLLGSSKDKSVVKSSKIDKKNCSDESKKGKTLDNQFSSIFEDVKSFFMLPFKKESDIHPILNYESAIQYFIDERPDDPSVAKGAILRQKHKNGYSVIQVFLSADNKLVQQKNGTPYGRGITVKEMDAELSESFGQNDLIIVE